jgi:hypothetical protein
VIRLAERASGIMAKLSLLARLEEQSRWRRRAQGRWTLTR